ncbi:hypothetical protein GPECTOR_298g807 [Gonium pectorale]|uniref:Uncharacterized protein n=1 Tax=Gonium pectorale TaxID=33097 RepID=A0A150FVV0_GONPE|nr:hypothetical protein GPECTOR_298g807 [Gonium pectorale]|eukprot:KXZ41743.1 hypothetical protein GPECTOR_298g807 [Gonium pectorale]
MRHAAALTTALILLSALAHAQTAANATHTPLGTGVQADVHPYCKCSKRGCQPYARKVVDMTPALRAATALPDGACIFNPALIRISGSLYCTFTRVYVAADPAKRCVPGQLDRPPFMDAWNGTLANMLAVVRIRRKRLTSEVAVTVMGYQYLDQVNLEDGRLFRDQHGRIFLYLSVPYGKYGGDRASVNSVYRVYISCKRGAGAGAGNSTAAPASLAASTASGGNATVTCVARLGSPRLLRYDRSLAWEKNWVPWNGTSLMSYSHYGPFGPHSVFNWSSYREPHPHSRFVAAANESFFHAFHDTFMHLIHLSGGTPAILEASGGSFLAVGHVRIHPGCLHPQSIPGLAALLGDRVRTNCAHMLKLPTEMKEHIPFRTFMYRDPRGNMSKHYHVDYAFFLYRFNSTPPYAVTHISHGILPPSDDHFGIVFPSGLERLGSDYVISYGDADQAAKLMLLKQADINKLLVPLPVMHARIIAYSVCTLPFAPGLAASALMGVGPGG